MVPFASFTVGGNWVINADTLKTIAPGDTNTDFCMTFHLFTLYKRLANGRFLPWMCLVILCMVVIWVKQPTFSMRISRRTYAYQPSTKET